MADTDDRLEAALQADQRISKLESEFKARSDAERPWWRNSATITLLGAFVAGILPLVTAINGYFANQREAARLMVEQQNKIRQQYLDRVLRPGVTEAEQKSIYGLLARLSSDPEMQQWAKDQLNVAEAMVKNLEARLHDAEKQVSDLEAGDKNKKEEAQKKLEAEMAALRFRLGIVGFPGFGVVDPPEDPRAQYQGVPTCKVKLTSDPPGAEVTVSYMSYILHERIPAGQLEEVPADTLKFTFQWESRVLTEAIDVRPCSSPKELKGSLSSGTIRWVQ